ncbi:hypothetical protein [Sphingobium lignivorans]|uniref:hypothetical protein n=1 Tax=Sphingobium lignivorans TaxID=2735886 RepID=UPI001620A1D7|nr:hypothetical protein [Sphingobium lignivorans]
MHLTGLPRFRAASPFQAAAALAILLCAGSATAQSPNAPQHSAAQAQDESSKASLALAELARTFLSLALEVGTHEAEYVDAYYGPASLKAAADSAPRSRKDLQKAAEAAVVRIDALSPALRAPQDQARARALRGFYRAAATRLAMIGGARFPFLDEAEGLFGIRPDLKPLSHYDDLLARLETLLPGPGTLAARVDAFQDRYVVAKDRVPAVMKAAIGECRRRTLAHFDLPADESFDMGFVTDKPWSGYNYYKGAFHSRIEINMDLPARVGRAVDLGCHEGYPGHHVLNIMIERTLVGQRGWKEYQVNPLYSPQSLIAEGSANYGIDLAFPGEEQLAFERDVLFPLAGLDPAGAEALWKVRKATEELGGARMTIAKMYLDGEVDRATALELLKTYQLVSAERAEQSLGFIEHYRSYVINYHLGRTLVHDYVERGAPDEATRWERMRHVLSDAVLPTDLLVR